MSATDKIKECLQRKSPGLDLSSLGLTEIPSDLFTAKHITRLNLSFNKLQEIPSGLTELIELKTLDLRGNRIVDLPETFNRLKNLETLFLSENMLSCVPACLKELPALNVISLKSNKIKVIPEWVIELNLLSLENNPVEDPPIEVYQRGINAIRNYFEDKRVGTFKINEAKLIIVGEPAAGKTSLMRKLVNPDYILDPNCPSTLGIDITPFFFSINHSSEFRINIWDFGGQEIYHATHQFFLTKRSLYLLVADNRAEDTDFNYWLQTIKTLSANSPVVVVQNEKQSRKKDLNYPALRRTFPEIVEYHAFDLLKEDAKTQALRQRIEEIMLELPHIGNELPISWVRIRQELEKLSQSKPFIPFQDYIEICSSIGDLSEQKAVFLSEYFHDLGVFLHFHDSLLLKKWVILKPEWGTEAVYRILDDETVLARTGYVSAKDILRIWADKTYSGMHDELLELMMRFELCYKVENKKEYIVPQLLSRSEPKGLPALKKDHAILTYRYDFMPKGILPRLIVRLHNYVADKRAVWREGLLIRRDDSVAVIKEAYSRREIRIEISGSSRRELVGIIDDHINRINQTFSTVKVNRLLECNCSVCSTSPTKAEHDYGTLQNFLSNNVRDTRCPISVDLISISKLIDANLGFVQSHSHTRIFLSYADENKGEVNQIVKHLRTFKKDNKWEFFDKKSLAKGQNAQSLATTTLNTSQIFVAFISADYFQNSDLGDHELRVAMDRHNEGHMRVIPVVIEPCFYEESIIRELSTVTAEGLPISLAPKKEKAYFEAASEIKRSVEDFKLIIQQAERASAEAAGEVD